MSKSGPGRLSATIVGEMYIQDQPNHADNYKVIITVADTYAPIIGLLKGIESNVGVDEVTGTFTIKAKGKYKFDGVASLAPTAGTILHFAVFVERPPGSATIQKQIETGLDFQNSQDTNTFSGTGWLDLERGDIITVQGKSSNAPVTVQINHMNISITRRGI